MDEWLSNHSSCFPRFRKEMMWCLRVTPGLNTSSVGFGCTPWEVSCVWNHRVEQRMMMSSNGNIFCVTGPLCGEFIGQLLCDSSCHSSLYNQLKKWVRAYKIYLHNSTCDYEERFCMCVDSRYWDKTVVRSKWQCLVQPVSKISSK